MATVLAFLATAAAPAAAYEPPSGVDACGVIMAAFDRTEPRQFGLSGMQRDIVACFENGAAELRLPALRRAWMADPAIRDFRGLQESDWDFNDPNSILGFGEIGLEIDVTWMVAQIFGETPIVASIEPDPAGSRTSAGMSLAWLIGFVR